MPSEDTRINSEWEAYLDGLLKKCGESKAVDRHDDYLFDQISRYRVALANRSLVDLPQIIGAYRESADVREEAAKLLSWLVENNRSLDITPLARLLACFASDRYPCEYTRYEALACLSRMLPEVSHADLQDWSSRAVLRDVSSEIYSEVEWLCRPWTARGMLTILAGDPEVGKSTLAVSLAKQAEGTTVWLSREEGMLSLMARRWHVAEGQGVLRLLHCPRSFGHDMERHLSAIRRAKNLSYVVVDPWTSLLRRSGDSNDDVASRAVLEPLCEIARDLNCAVLALAHRNKSSIVKSRGMRDVAGSLGGIIGAARSVLLVTKESDADDCIRTVSHVKSNISRRAPPRQFRTQAVCEDRWPDAPPLVVQWLDERLREPHLEIVYDAIKHGAKRLSEIVQYAVGEGLTVSERQLNRYLRTLVQQGRVLMLGKGPKTTYTVSRGGFEGSGAAKNPQSPRLS